MILHHNFKEMLREIIWSTNNPGLEQKYLVPDDYNHRLLDEIVDEFVRDVKQEVLDDVYDGYVRKDKY